MTTTLKDVARHAGVSSATASFVLNNRKGSIRVSDATRDRVFQAAQELGYSPNRAARALRTRKSFTVGIISFDTNDPIANAYTSALDRFLVTQGYRTIVGDANHSTERAMRHLRYFVSAGIDGLILLASSYQPDFEELNKLRADTGLNVISILRDFSVFGLQSFNVDYRSGTRNATQHLLDQGYRGIGVIVGSNIYQPDNTERLEGILEACHERQIEIKPAYIVNEDEGGWNPWVGYRSMEKLLDLNPLPEVVGAFDDVTAFGAIRAIYDRGMRVPEDIAVMGFDDVMVSAFYNPPLTTSRHPVEQLAGAATRYLIDAIETGVESSPACELFLPELVVRKSTRQLNV